MLPDMEGQRIALLLAPVVEVFGPRVLHGDFEREIRRPVFPPKCLPEIPHLKISNQAILSHVSINF